MIGLPGHNHRAALAKCHQRQCTQHRASPVVGQHLPYRSTGLVHRVIPASEPALEAPRGRVWAVPASRLNYQRYHGWDIECSLRDSKDLRFGMGLGTIRVKSPERRDRLWLINAFAVVLLTLLGAAGEALGYDRMLKTNTAKRRAHSLFRQGCLLYDLIPTMRDDWLRPLMQRFSQMLHEQPLFADVFGPV